MSRVKIYPIALVVLIVTVFIPAVVSNRYAVANWFTTDDAFYYFKVAENFVHGEGITFDGINKANGFHPLWMILIAPVFYFSKVDLFLPLRLVILIQGMLTVGMGLVFFRLAQHFASDAVAFVMAALWALLPEILDITSNGTEAALNALLLTVFWSAVIRSSTETMELFPSPKKILWLSFWSILLVFARLDNVYLMLVAGIWILVSFIRKSLRSDQPITLLEIFKVGMNYFGPVALMIGLYMVINLLVFDTYLPVSGQIKGWWGSLETTAYGKPVSSFRNYVGDFFSPKKGVGPWSLVTSKIDSLSNSLVTSRGRNSFSVGLYLELIMAALIGFLIAEKKKYFQEAVAKAAVPVLFTGTLFHLSHYKVLGYVGQRSWYWISETFLLVILGTILLEAGVRYLADGKHPVSKPLSFVLLAIVLISLILVPHMKTIGSSDNPNPVETHYYLRKTHWLESRTEPGALIGMTGAGSTGYFIRDRTIFNLDGLINSKAYFDSLKSNQASAYLDEVGLDYIFAKRRIILDTDPYQDNFGFLNEISEKGTFENQLTLWELPD